MKISIKYFTAVSIYNEDIHYNTIRICNHYYHLQFQSQFPVSNAIEYHLINFYFKSTLVDHISNRILNAICRTILPPISVVWFSLKENKKKLMGWEFDYLIDRVACLLTMRSKIWLSELFSWIFFEWIRPGTGLTQLQDNWLASW